MKNESWILSNQKEPKKKYIPELLKFNKFVVASLKTINKQLLCIVKEGIHCRSIQNDKQRKVFCPLRQWGKGTKK